MEYERELTTTLESYFNRKGYSVLTEVRIPPRAIDMVLLDKNSLHTISVEAKLRNWRKAIWQATINSLYCHYSCIAMEERYGEKIPENILEENGIGLILVKKMAVKYRVTIKRLPVRSQKINRMLKKEIYLRFAQ